MRFTARAEFAAEHEFALGLFWPDPPHGASDDDYRALITSETGSTAYYPWFAFDFELESGRTPLDVFLERHGEGLAAGERAYLDRMAGSQMRLHEVVGLRLDEGLDLRDLATGTVVAVRERSATHQLARWDIVAARIIDGVSGMPEIDGLPFYFPPQLKGELEAVLRVCRREEAKVRKTPLADDNQAFSRQFFLIVLRIWLERVAFPPMPTLTTADGDSLAFTKALFDVSDPARLVQLFGGRDDLNSDDDGRFTWLEGTGEHRRILGTFHLEGRRLTFESISEERAERAQAFVETLAGDCVTYRLTRVEDPAQVMASRNKQGERGNRGKRGESADRRVVAPARAPRRGQRAAGSASESGLPPEVEAQLLHEFYDRHYHEWLDIPLPALSGRTPRHAARLKTQRHRVAELLKMFENHTEHDRREGRPAYDTTWMWAALGIERE
jgi:hypothetical protein